MIEWCSEKWLFNQLSSEQAIYCQILHTVWYIWWETERENWSWSLLGVKGLNWSPVDNQSSFSLADFTLLKKGNQEKPMHNSPMHSLPCLLCNSVDMVATLCHNSLICWLTALAAMANHTIIFVCGKCFEPRGISYLFSVTIWVRVVFRKIICLHRPVSIFWIFNVGTGNIFLALFAGWHLDQQVHVRPCAGFPVKFPLEETEFPHSLPCYYTTRQYTANRRYVRRAWL